MCSTFIHWDWTTGFMYELHPGHIFQTLGGESGEMVCRQPGWSKLQKVDGCASRLERPPNITPSCCQASRVASLFLEPTPEPTNPFFTPIQSHQKICLFEFFLINYLYSSHWFHQVVNAIPRILNACFDFSVLL